MHGFYFTDGASSPGKVCAGGHVSGAPGKTLMILGGWPVSSPQRHVSGSGRMWQGTIVLASLSLGISMVSENQYNKAQFFLQ